MKAKENMTKTVACLKSTQSLNDAVQLMWENDCGWIAVLDENNKLLGAITDRDIAMAAYINLTERDLPIFQ